MNVEALSAQYHDLVVTACEWRAMGLADPHAMAADVFAALDERRDHDLKDLYRAIDKVVLSAYQHYSDKVSLIERLRLGTLLGGSGPRNPADDFLKALSNLRGKDRQLLQLRFWDELDEAEAAEVLGISIEQVRENLAKAGMRYLTKLSRTHPDLAISDVVDTIASIKPGIYRRFGAS
ncbi:MAG: sigma factor-like helix-turn-helix DNA-binding protein [Propionicimonas sp.]